MTIEGLVPQLPRYVVAPLSSMLQNATNLVRDRPVLDVYLDATTELHGLYDPVAYGLTASDDYYETSVATIRALGEDLQAAPDLVSNLTMNLASYRTLLDFRAGWLHDAREAPERVFIAAELGRDPDASPAWLLTALQQSSQRAHASMNAIAYEHSLVWRVLRDVAGLGTGFDAKELARDFRRGLAG